MPTGQLPIRATGN